MTSVDSVTEALEKIKPLMLKPTKGGAPGLELADRIGEVRKLLAQQEARWVSIPEARRLLAMSSDRYVKGWIRLGMLQSRTLPNGRTQVLLDDVLRQRENKEALTAIDLGEDATAEETMRLLRPHIYGNPVARSADPTR